MRGDFVAIKLVSVRSSSSESMHVQWQEQDRWEHSGYLKSLLWMIIKANAGSGSRVMVCTLDGDFIKEFRF